MPRRDPLHKVAGGLEDSLHEVHILGKKQDIPHQASDGFGFGDGFDLVFRRLLEEKQASDGCGAIFSYPCEFTSEGSSKARYPLLSRRI